MIKYKLPAGIILMFIVSACNSEDSLLHTVQPQEPTMSGYKIAPEYAVKCAIDIVAQFDENKTRTHRSLSSIELLSSNCATRSSNANIPDSSLYVVNFSDNSGFAIVSADYRLKPFYAVSDTGNFNINDTIENKGLAMVMNSIYNDINQTYGMTLPGVVDTIIWSHPILPPAPPIDNGYPLIEKIGPMINPNVAKWSQNSPFNESCPFVSNTTSRGAVGCVPLATAIIMSHYEWPDWLGSIPIDWDYYKRYGGTDFVLCGFLADLGGSDAYDAKYTYNSKTGQFLTSASIIDKGKKVFMKYGYVEPSDISDYNCSSLYNILKTNSPVIMTAENQDLKVAHAWVIDGYALYKHTILSQLNYGVVDYYWHMIWGWKGQCNGYFLMKSNGLSGSAYESGAEANDDTSTSLEIPYTGNFKVFGGFTPIK